MQVQEEVGDGLVQHPDVLLWEVEVGSAWVYAEYMPLKVLGVPLASPPVWDQGPAEPRRNDAHDELCFTVVPPPSAPTSF